MTTLAGRAFRIRRLLIVGVVILGALYSVFQDPLEGVLAPACSESLVLDPDTPAEVRAVLDDLQSRGLLYCPEVPEGVVGVGERLYWGSDGVNAVTYLDTAPDNPVLVDLNYDDSFVHARGGWPRPGVTTSVRPVYATDAPEGASFFWLMTGAPRPTNSSVIVEVVGRGAPQGMQHRDFFTDLDNLFNRFSGEPPTTERNRVETHFAIVPSRWEAVSGTWVNPEYAGDETTTMRAALRNAPPTEPVVYLVDSGPLGTGLWATGIMTGARPSLVLLPSSGAEAPGQRTSGSDGALESEAFTLWRDVETQALHVLAAFPPLEPGSRWVPLYRDASDGSERQLEPIVIPGPTGSATPTAAPVEASP